MFGERPRNDIALGKDGWNEAWKNPFVKESKDKFFALSQLQKQRIKDESADLFFAMLKRSR